MFRPLVCRPSCRCFQQHDFRLSGIARPLSQARGISSTAEPNHEWFFRKFRSADPSLPRSGSNRRERIVASLETRSTELPQKSFFRKFLSADPNLPRSPTNRRERIAANLETTRSRELPEYNSEWAEEWARETIDRDKEAYFIHHNLPKNEIKIWKQWRRNLSNLLGYWATGDAAAGRLPEILRGQSHVLERDLIDNALDNWSSWDEKRKKKAWHNLMFSTLWSCPDQALAVLQTTTQDTKLRGYAINDVIHILAKWQKTLGENKVIDHAKSLCDFTTEFFDARSDGSRCLRQNTIYNLIQDIDPRRIERLYSFLLDRKNKMHEYTFVAIATKLAKFPTHKQLALGIAIDAMKYCKVDLTAIHWRRLCTNILHIKSEDVGQSDDFSAANAFSLLLEHGFKPTMVSYTALIRTLCVSGHVDTAWRIFEIMRRHEIEPDPVLYATLVDGGKRIFKASTINKLAEDAAQRETIDVVFLNDLLASVFKFTEKERKEKKSNNQHVHSVPAFGPMLYYYAKVFNLAPLQVLIPLDLSAYVEQYAQEMPDGWYQAQTLFPGLEAATSAVSTKFDPTGATVGIMYIAFVKSLAQPIKLISLYAYFRQLINKKHPVATQFVREKGSFVHDVILKALLEHPGMQRPALDIVADMLRDAITDDVVRGIVKNQTRGGVRQKLPSDMDPDVTHPRPSIYTWNILLAGFLFSRQKEVGNKIAHMMRSRGMQPNNVTWNTLVSGYAGLQDVKKTVKALQGLESSGYRADEYTLRAFSRLVNQGRALMLMEKEILLNEIKGAAVNADASQGDEPVVDAHGEIPLDQEVDTKPSSWAMNSPLSRIFRVVHG